MTKYSAKDKLSVVNKYKEIIKNEFFPEVGLGELRLSVAKKAISEFEKLSDDKEVIADIMLFYVETGVEYTICYGDMDESFYYSMESMYSQAAKFIVYNELVEIFSSRCLKIVNDTTGMGWGFHDQLDEIYHEYFEIA